MTSFLKPPQKDSGEFVTDSAHEDKKGRADNSRRESEQMSEHTRTSNLEQMEASTPVWGVTSEGDSSGTTESVVGSGLTGSLGWEQLDPTGPLLYLERRKDFYSLKKPNQRAVVTTPPLQAAKMRLKNRWDFQSVQWMMSQCWPPSPRNTSTANYRTKDCDCFSGKMNAPSRKKACRHKHLGDHYKKVGSSFFPSVSFRAYFTCPVFPKAFLDSNVIFPCPES